MQTPTDQQVVEIFENRYFNFNRTLFSYMGVWPYDPPTRNIRKYLLQTFLILVGIPTCITIYLHYNDIERMLLNVVVFLVCLLMVLKQLAMILAEDKMKNLYITIAKSWLGTTNLEEKEILLEYSERGRLIAISYFIFFESFCVIFVIIPFLPKILDIIQPKEEKRPNVHVLDGELFLDKDDYHALYWFSEAALVTGTGSVCVSVDTMFIICVEHCCSLYAIISHRMRKLDAIVHDNTTGKDIKSYDYITGIIELHQSSVNFTVTLNDAFSMLFLYVLLANLICIPLTAVAVIATLDKPYDCFRYAFMLLILIIHLFFLFWPGQKILDHGTELIFANYNNSWYETPQRTKKMQLILAARCIEPIVLVAGNLMLMNFETYASIVRTSMSYITVVASFRG